MQIILHGVYIAQKGHVNWHFYEISENPPNMEQKTTNCFS